VRIVLCTLAGAILGSGIAVNVATRQVDGWGLIIPLGVAGLVAGAVVGAGIGAVTG
jgi:uncharacterized membrane protein HdeD (DUF308 family)